MNLKLKLFNDEDNTKNYIINNESDSNFITITFTKTIDQPFFTLSNQINNSNFNLLSLYENWDYSRFELYCEDKKLVFGDIDFGSLKYNLNGNNIYLENIIETLIFKALLYEEVFE